MRVGEGISPFPTLLQCCIANKLQNQRSCSPMLTPSEADFSCSCHQGQLYGPPPAPRKVQGLSLNRQGQFSCFHDPRASSPTCGRWQGKGREEHVSLLPSCLVWAMSGRASSPTLITLGQSHLQLAKCVERDGGLLSRALKLVKGWGQLSSSHAPT